MTPTLGYIFKGKIIVRYKDHEETISAGQAYYIAPGHTYHIQVRNAKI